MNHHGSLIFRSSLAGVATLSALSDFNDGPMNLFLCTHITKYIVLFQPRAALAGHQPDAIGVIFFLARSTIVTQITGTPCVVVQQVRTLYLISFYLSGFMNPSNAISSLRIRFSCLHFHPIERNTSLHCWPIMHQFSKHKASLVLPPGGRIGFLLIVDQSDCHSLAICTSTSRST